MTSSSSSSDFSNPLANLLDDSFSDDLDHEKDDDQEEGEGEGDFGQPEFKPQIETLLNPGLLILQSSEHSAKKILDTFGSWELHSDSLMLYHRQLKKRFMLSQLDTPLKMMKMVVALSTKPPSSPNHSWDIENLIRAIDHATQKKFNKPLYKLMSMSQDTAKLNWEDGTYTLNGSSQKLHF